MRMKQRIHAKLHTRRGFTLMETLLAVMILLLVSIIVATGIPTAKNAYEKVVLASNAEVLLSTTISTLRNELGTAQEVAVDGDRAIVYYNSIRGASSMIWVEGDDTPIQFTRYYSEEESVEELPEGINKSVPLISQKTATADLYVTCDSVSCTNGIVQFRGLSVKRGSSVLASRDTLSIRLISYRGE